MVGDLWCYYYSCFWGAMNCAHIRWQTKSINVVCIPTTLSTGCSPVSLLGPSHSLRLQMWWKYSRTEMRSGAWRWDWILQTHDKTVRDEELLVMGEQRPWFLEMDATPGEDAVKTAEMTAMDWEYYINLVDKAAASCESIDSQEVLLWVKCYQAESHATAKSFVKRRVSLCGKLQSCLVLTNGHGHPNLQQPPPWSVRSHQHQGKTFHQKKHCNSDDH